jgi:2'-hydroxyisoflavone reductase
MPTTRRDLLKLSALAAGLAGLGTSVAAAEPKPAPGKLRILILGGTGFTGPHQIRYALARGHEITVFNRGKRPNEFKGRVEELTGDRETNDYASLAGEREWDVVIDNPTSVPHWVRDAAAVLKGRTKHYIFISTSRRRPRSSR